MGLFTNFEQRPHPNPTPSIPATDVKTPDGSQAGLFPHKQHGHRRHETQMEYMPDIG